jgi:geranylgeranyl diphosphate synthase type 3
MKRVNSLKHPDAITVCIDEMLEIYYGQGLEIYWRDNYTCPSIEEYKEMMKKSKYRTEP